MALPALLVGPLLEITKSVISKVLPPDKLAESDRLQLEQEFQLAIMAQDWRAVEAEMADRASARTLAASDIAKGNALSSFLAAVVRPTWGLGALVLVAYSIVSDVPIQPVFESIVQTVLMFYFGGRTLEKVLPTLVGGYTEAKKATSPTRSDASAP